MTLMKFISRHWKKLLLLILGLPILLFAVAVTIIYSKQEQLVQHYLEEFNADIHGHVVIKRSSVAPFKSFPYISIDLQGFSVYESDDLSLHPLLELEDVYVGFDFWKLLGGKTVIKSVVLKDGHLDVVQDSNAALNISKAFKPTKPVEEVSEALNLKLKSIQLENVDISKFNEVNKTKIDLFIKKGEIGVEMNEDQALLHADMNYILTIIKDSKSTFFRDKHGTLNTDLSFDFKTMFLDFAPSQISVEKALFEFEGHIELTNEYSIDFNLRGRKPNFDLFLSFAPEELAPVFKRYENSGDVFFNASIQGPTLNKQPHIEARFGCKETYISNQFNKKKVDQLQFNAFFTNGDSNNLETMRFELKDFKARPEAGKFKGSLIVENFLSPEIDMRVQSNFNLDFLAQFFELDNLYKLKGQVLLDLSFHDIVDLNQPEKSLEKINQAYFASLKINDLSFESPDFHLPVKKISVSAQTKGQDLVIEKIDAKIGESDLFIQGRLSNLPDLLHHSQQNIQLELSLNSKLLDLKDLTKSKKNPEQYIDDKIKNFKTHFYFVGTAKDLTEFKHLPNGHFVLDQLYASFQNYPHKLHDFNIDLKIDEQNIQLDKFHGEIDKSDFDVVGSLSNYPMFMQVEANGASNVSLKVNSRSLILKDLLTYNGTNFLPLEYRDEVLSDLKLLCHSAINFKESKLFSTDLFIDGLEGKMKIHPLKLEQFTGRIHVEDEHLVVESLNGKIGRSKFDCFLNYYFGQDPKIKKRDNIFKINASKLDMDELMSFPPNKPSSKVDHDNVFNLYELPFVDMRFDVHINELIYSKQHIKNIHAKLHTTVNHFLHIDRLDLDVADGHLKGSGYFDGRDPKKIYLNPTFKFDQLDLSKLMLKFDNFGQDELISSNLTGKINGQLSGKIRMHTDLVPIIGESIIKLDFKVVQGIVIGYAPFLALEDFLKDKNLHRIAFDTLQNTITLDKGTMTVPSMTINSSLGFLIVEGTQDMNLNMNYLIRVPFKMVTQAASQKLFKRKKEEIDPSKNDEIIYLDPEKKTSFVNVRVIGTPENYKVSVERKKR